MTHGLFTVSGVVGLTQQMYYTSVVIDTASAYKFIWKSFLRKRWLHLQRSSESAAVLGDANSQSVTINGSITLSARLGKYKCRSTFLIANENFAVLVLLGTD